MKDHNGLNRSLWVSHTAMPAGTPLSGHQATEIAVVGAGIAGLTTAYLLAKEGRDVTVVEADRPGTGQTARTTAHLSWAIDDRIYEVERIHGTEKARLAVESHFAAINRIEAIVREEAIECDFHRVPGYLFVGEGEDPAELDRELEAAHRAGFTDVERIEGPLGPCLLFPSQARFHPLKYLRGLRAAFLAAGGKLYTDARVVNVATGPTCELSLEAGGRLTAAHVVVATNSPITNRFLLHTKMHPYLSYAIAIEIDSDSVADALFWDTEDPYHYVRRQTDEGRDLLIVGGEDQKTGQIDDEKDPYANLESWARARFQGLGAVRFHWSGQVMETLDGLAFLGRNPLAPGNVYVACGDSGMGMTHGMIAGMLLTDLIQGRPNAWTEIYDPARKPAKTAGEFVTENANMAFQYRDYVTPGEVTSTDAIAPGTGAVVREGLHKVAAYRGRDGKLHKCSAVCPHLGGIVRWNNDEKTWDCPLHGSRFGAEGECIQGPAYLGLTPLEEAAEEAPQKSAHAAP